MRILLALTFVRVRLTMSRNLLSERGLRAILLQDGLDVAAGNLSGADWPYPAILRILLLLRLLPSDQVLLQLLDQRSALVRPDAMYARRTSQMSCLCLRGLITRVMLLLQCFHASMLVQNELVSLWSAHFTQVLARARCSGV
jgi:hypothetical protein